MIGLVQSLILVCFWVGLARHWFPLGVRGEWEWLRLGPGAQVSVLPLGLALAGIGGFSWFAVLGARSLSRGGSTRREVGWVSLLALAAIGVQGVVQEGAPIGYGLAKWIIALESSGASGYHSVARTQMPAGLGPFLQAYPAWIRQQDSLHIGTHPPGLFVVARILDDLTQRNENLARLVIALAPGSAAPAVQLARGSGSLTRSEAAALTLTGALTLFGSALTVIPLYLLARAGRPAPVAWATAVLWPLLPAANLFQPTADTAFPLLSTSALAFAVWAVQCPRISTRLTLAIAAGGLLAIGMQFTLVFLAIGLVVAILLLAEPGLGDWRVRLALIAATGLGFLGTTGAWFLLTAANPVAIWWTNQGHHAQFYWEYPRSRLAWTWVNLAESIVAIGLPSAVWAVLAFTRPRSVPTATWAVLLVLGLLTLSGRSLSEVARLWLPMDPPILLGAAIAWNRWGNNPTSLGWTVGLVGLQTAMLQAMIQVVYPI